MMLFYLFDDAGKFMGTQVLPSGITPENGTLEMPGTALINPLWDGLAWIECPLEPIALSKVAFMDLSYLALGANLNAGIARYGQIIRQARLSDDDSVLAALERYQHATEFQKNDVAIFLSILVASVDVDLSQAESDAIIAAWPEVA